MAYDCRESEDNFGSSTAEKKIVSANDVQIGGDHYRKHGKTGEQLWDRIARLKLDFFQGTIMRYIERWRDKGGVEDLHKARHYLDKYIELMTAEQEVNKEQCNG